MKTDKISKVGDYVFLFFDKSGSIFSARILEKTVKETISDGLKTEYILEAYNREADQISSQRIKYSEDKCKMFSDLKDLEKELQNHVAQAVKAMLFDCKETFEIAKKKSEENKI